MKTVLIVKLGYCETLVNEDGFVPSLGDVFRHTVILHRYAGDRVTWLTSESALPLLRSNPLIHELMIYERGIENFLAGREFDEIVNFEKARVLCDMARAVKARRRYGFGWGHGQVKAHRLAQPALDIANGKDHFLPIQALLYQMIGAYWNGEDYVLGYSPRSRPAYDVGFNFRVGSKWPTKAWPMRQWQILEILCREAGLTVSWQEGESELDSYMDWINAGRVIVTCDSLGMHLGLAMKKRVVALFGPTPADHIHMYGRGLIIRANWGCPRHPCMRQKCSEAGENCMDAIRPETVMRVVRNMVEPAEAARSEPAPVPAARARPLAEALP